MCFLPKEVPLAFGIKLVWWCWIFLTFTCLERFWFLHQIWMRLLLLDRLFLVDVSSLSSLKMYHAIPFWLVKFLLRNQLIAWWEFPCMLSFFPCCFQYFISVFNFGQFDDCVLVCSSLGLSCLGLCTSWTWLTISFPMFGKFSAITSSNIFSGPISLSSPSGTPCNSNVGVFNVVPEVS